PHEVGRAFNILRKAAVDDEKHPGWPKDTPDDKGGQFRPKFSSIASEAGKDAAEASKKLVVKKTKKLLARRAIRTLLKSLLSWRRISRVGAEVGSNAIPGLDVIGDAALIEDIAEAASEFEELTLESEKAVDFINQGPHTLDELRAVPDDLSFSSFEGFKKTDIEKFAGPAGDGYEWHHIVEQGANGETLATSDLQSTRNIVRIPKALHEIITSEYASVDNEVGMTFRKSLSGKSFEEQTELGLNRLKKLGILKD
ncbi:MAG: hypothetical protein P4L76_16405, partial [Beijerinckiaceae bacterium]|nr:hypothetical protein [Beijerinckiaceae bacterium]